MEERRLLASEGPGGEERGSALHIVRDGFKFRYRDKYAMSVYCRLSIFYVTE